MTFISITFLSFVVFLAFIYHASHKDYRPYILIFGNLIFLLSLGLLTFLSFLGITFLTYLCAVCIKQSNKNSVQQKGWLLLCITGNISLILWSRYFLRESAYGLMYTLFPSNLVTVGLSFYALQSIDYVAWQSKPGVRREGFIPLFIYLGFFPKFLAGPIESAETFMSQLVSVRPLSAENALSALKRILWGVFKKTVVANRLGLLWGPILLEPSKFSSFEIILAVYVLAFHIYCDFSAYCDIAIGAARLFGFELSENFNNPYNARSIQEFWKRWHITFTYWLKDHIYVPLGGRKVSKTRWVLNVFAVFAVSWLWHGATATFFIWAGAHALLYLIGMLTKSTRAKAFYKINSLLGAHLVHLFQVLITFHLVALTWIPFVSTSAEQVWEVFRCLFSIQIPVTSMSMTSFKPLMGIEGIILLVGTVAWLLISVNVRFNKLFFHISKGKSIIAELALIDLLIVLIIFSYGMSGSEFMYVYY